MNLSATVSNALAGVALLWFVGLSAVVVATDLKWRRIPNRVILPALLGLSAVCSLPYVAALLLAPSTAGSRLQAMLSGFMGAAALFCACLPLVALGSLGGGDAKLSSVIGLLLGYFGGWTAVLLGVSLAWGAAGLWAAVQSLTLRLSRAETWHDTRAPPTLPLAPFLVGGAWAALLLTA